MKLKLEQKRNYAALALNVAYERFADSLRHCNGARAAIPAAFKGGEVNQLISLFFTHVCGGQAERLHLGFHEVGGQLAVYLWIGKNYKTNAALWQEGCAWEKHLKQLAGEAMTVEVRFLDPAFWLQRHGGAGVHHIEITCN